MTESEARDITGGLSHTAKMPCPSFSLPAAACKTGSKLAGQAGTVCSSCYAKKGNYARFPVVKNLLQHRLDLLEHWIATKPSTWVEAMVTLIGDYRYFRWHDSGDVQSEAHMAAIAKVAHHLPKTDFWLPTHEVWVARQAAKGAYPDNLVVRLSAAKVDGPPSRMAGLTSTVHLLTVPKSEDLCRAPENGNKCGTCRKCWDRGVRNIAYMFH